MLRIYYQILFYISQMFLYMQRGYKLYLNIPYKNSHFLSSMTDVYFWHFASSNMADMKKS